MTTVSVVVTIWKDSYGPDTPRQLTLGDSYDIIESDDPSFQWYRDQIVGLVAANVLDAYIEDTVLMTPGGGPVSTASKILRSFVGLYS